MPPTEGSVAGLCPGEDTRLDGPRASASLAAPEFIEEMNKRRHDRSSQDNESTDQTNVAVTSSSSREKGVLGRTEMQLDERGAKQVLLKHSL